MAEEHAVTLAAGMASEGLRPVTAIYSTFLQRAYDQILHDVCLQCLPVVLALDRAGLVGEDGPTHHGIFDLSYLRTMPNLTIMAPATLDELDVMLAEAVKHDGPTAIRYSKEVACLDDAGPLESIAVGRAAVLRDGEDLALLAVGSMVGAALDTAALLAHDGIEATVVNARFVKPLDTLTLLTAVRRARLIVTLEENSVTGGFGSAVQELLANEGVTVPILTLGIPDCFVEQGRRDALLERLHLTPAHIAAAIQSHLPPCQKNACS